jgi:hypothetical protein
VPVQGCTLTFYLTFNKKYPFRQVINKARRLPGLPQCLRSAVLASDFLRTQPKGSPIELGPDCVVDGREIFHPLFESSSRAEKRRRAVLCLMVG